MVKKENQLLEQLIQEHGVEKYVPNIKKVMERRLPEVERFIHDVGMTLGNGRPKQRTPNVLVYWRYLKWCQAEGETPIDRTNFFILLRHYFPGSIPYGSRRRGKIKYPTIKFTHCMPEPFEVSRQEKRQAEMHLRDEMEARKKLWAEKRARKQETK